ncbi:ornithine carbamoyltransferase [Candidatus Daviesbacteria bacterium]|nr:ornithine carbamoyltransferase [Candidatus Daviesbacteria bacterium]
MNEGIKHFLSITDLSAKEIWQVLTLAKNMKTNPQTQPNLDGKQMVMLFEKPSLRTKLSFDIAMNQLGGHSVYFGAQEVGLDKREAVSDVAQVISSMADLVVARVFSHKVLQEYSQYSQIPVINALSDLEHPCQALADLLTIWEIKGEIAGLTLGFIGDGNNNVPHSLALGCALLGMNFKVASPRGYWMKEEVREVSKDLSKDTAATVTETEHPEEAVKEADVVYTDTWVSMGQEVEEKIRLAVFKPYQVNSNLISLAKPEAIFMHCMPVHKEQEVTSEIVEGPQSVIIQQAKNRLYTAKALIAYLLTS